MKKFTFILTIVLLTACASKGVQSEEYRVGDWKVLISDNVSIASTSDQYGSVFGYICATTACQYFYNLEINCKDDDIYPVLTNADSGVRALETKCGTLFGTQLQLFQNDLTTVVTRDNNFSIVVALQDEFKSAHFSLRGSNQAISDVASRTNRNSSSNNNYL